MGTQQQPQSLGHQDHLDRQVFADCNRLGAGETDPAFRQADPLGGADVAQQALGDGLAEQVDALVHYLEVVGQGAVTLTDMPQQVLGLEVHQVQVAEQIEQRRAVMQHIAGQGLGAAQWGEIQCDRVIDTIVFAAIIYILSRHGEPMVAVVV